MPDGGDVSTATVRDGSGVIAELTGTGDLAGELTVHPVEEASLLEAPGMVTRPVEVHLADENAGGLDSARLVLPFDAAAVTSAPADLRVFTFDPAIEHWVPAGTDQQVDVVAGTVSTTVEHFSIFAIFDVRNWEATLTGLGGSCVPGNPGTGEPVFVDVAFVLDSSGSMLTNDRTGLRKESAKQFVNALLDEDRGVVVDFDSSAVILQRLTSDKAALRAAIDRVGASGGTNIGAGVDAGLTALAANTDDTRVQMMILLTDGVGSYSQSYTDTAAREGHHRLHRGAGLRRRPRPSGGHRRRHRRSVLPGHVRRGPARGLPGDRGGLRRRRPGHRRGRSDGLHRGERRHRRQRPDLHL